ncbi:MAG: heme o synthase [Terriglobales bacterium]|nr:heme o synthase [Terriglobales bacterium]
MTESSATTASSAKLRDYYALTKPEVNLLILMTTSAGYYLGSTGPLRIGRLLITLAGTLLVASGTATLNQWMERRYDAQMRRTASRPLASGRLSGREACGFGVALSVAGGTLLAITVNLASALLAIGTLLAYLLIYTPLKRKTPLCTLLGAVPGAMPTLIGWAAASGGIGRRAWLLFGILFLWQFPHFLAIALLYREDYAGAGFRMLPSFDVDGRFTKAEIVVFAVVLVILTMLPLAGRNGTAYLFIMFAAGIFFVYHTANLARSSGSRVLASRVVHASVIYLPVVLGTMMAWKA